MGGTSSSETTETEDLSQLTGYTLEEIKKHDKEDDLWLIVQQKIYDLSKFEHPGGKKILIDVVGVDAYEQFEEAQHSNTAREEMKALLIGKVVEKKSCGGDCKCVEDDPKPTTATTDTTDTTATTATTATTDPTLPSVLVLYGSQGGTAKQCAENLADILRSLDRFQVTISVMNDFEPEDIATKQYVCYVCSTHTDGTPPANAKFMYAWLEDASTDHRISNEFFINVQFAVFGLGSSDYDNNFNTAAKMIHGWNTALGATSMCKEGVSDAANDTPTEVFNTWVTKSFLPGFDKKKTRKTVNAIDYEYDDGEEEEGEEEEVEDSLVDLEDLGKVVKKQKDALEEEKKGVVKEMLTHKNREALTKQGYKIIGSHSGVKLCRWTKAMLRGRGGCYKHTFYGITSYQCMEMTPSLACANKCVFCWRHHTNPVAKEWKWVMDPPEMIIEESVTKHQQMIKQMRGVPGVQPERFKEAFTVRHCALSLVGEPIMYPKINEYLKLLHEKKISSFLVTNAQFPDRIDQLDPVCQLYVSVDAATPEDLKAVDRPLFSDYWERFLQCLTSLKSKQVRTVYRLTLVKSMNMTEVAEYAKLVLLGCPTFIEIKGVTFCGNNNSDSVTMKNVPFHQEVRNFCEELCKHLDGNYEIACEHAHSCCILISDTKLKVNGVWNTWIDYPKFTELVLKYYETGETFTDIDYIAPTPAWAIYGSEEEGFDPEETRWRRKAKGAGAKSAGTIAVEQTK